MAGESSKRMKIECGGSGNPLPPQPVPSPPGPPVPLPVLPQPVELDAIQLDAIPNDLPRFGVVCVCPTAYRFILDRNDYAYRFMCEDCDRYYSFKAFALEKIQPQPKPQPELPPQLPIIQIVNCECATFHHISVSSNDVFLNVQCMICQGQTDFLILEQCPDSVSKALTAAETIPYKDLPDVVCVHELLFTCHCSKRHIIKSSSGDLRFSFVCLQCNGKYLFVLGGTYHFPAAGPEFLPKFLPFAVARG